MTGSSRWLCHNTLRRPCAAPSRSSTRRSPETVGMATPNTGRPATCAGSGSSSYSGVQEQPCDPQQPCGHSSLAAHVPLIHTLPPQQEATDDGQHSNLLAAQATVVPHLAEVGCTLDQRRELQVLAAGEVVRLRIAGCQRHLNLPQLKQAAAAGAGNRANAAPAPALAAASQNPRFSSTITSACHSCHPPLEWCVAAARRRCGC